MGIFLKLLTQKKRFRNGSPKNYILEIALLKSSFLKLCPKKIHFRNCSLKIALSKKHVFKITLSKNTFSNLISQKTLT